MPNIFLKSNSVLLMPAFAILMLLTSCNQKFAKDDYRAYFGGEILNPTNRYVLFCKDNEVIDTIALNDDNTFFKSFESLEPGMYTFRHDPEYQYVYFNKNDSLMVRINSRDFDESIVFCGRGDRKNNFLMELYLRNENHKNQLFPLFDKDLETYMRNIDSAYAANTKFYNMQKETIKWEPEFDIFAKAMLDYNYFSKKEIYPQIHAARTGNTVEIPAGFYDYRNQIDYNNATLSTFSPFITYLSQMLNNKATVNSTTEFNQIELALQSNINKLKIADTLIRSEKIKNTLLNSIAFNYLLEDQNIINNKKFLDTYFKVSTDKSSKNEILEIGRAIAELTPGNKLPDVELISVDGTIISSDQVANGANTVFFFWTENLNSHFINASKKALELKKLHPDYNFVAINIDHDRQNWQKELSKYDVTGITQLQCSNFDEMRKKWAIIKIHRTIIVNSDGTIHDAFTNLFNSDFSAKLAKPTLLASN